MVGKRKEEEEFGNSEKFLTTSLSCPFTALSSSSSSYTIGAADDDDDDDDDAAAGVKTMLTLLF